MVMMYKNKKAFIDNISKALELSNTTVAKVDYVVLTRYSDFLKVDVYYEYVIVTFIGGARSIRHVGGNSDSANFREIGKLIDGGYYDEVEHYEDLLNKEGFTIIEL